MTELQHIARVHGNEAAFELLLLRQKVSGLSSLAALETFLSAYEVRPGVLADRLAAHALGGLLMPLLPPVLSAHADMTQLVRRVNSKARYNLMLLSEMLRLQELCKERGLEVIFTKGVLLSHMLCGDYSSRSAADLDILVRIDDFLRVRDLLIEDGYRERYPFPLNELPYFLQYQREAAFAKPTASGVQLHVELQWSVLPAYYRMPYGNDYFFRHTAQVVMGQSTLNTLAPTQHLLLLLAHHGGGDLWRNLRHLADISLFIQQQGSAIHWPEVALRTREWGIEKATACGFAMANTLVSPQDIGHWDLRVAPALMERCVQHVLSVPMLPKQRTHRATFMHQMRLCDSASDRWALLKGYLSRYASPGMDELALVRLPRVLFPAYLLIRQFRFLYKGRMTEAVKQHADG